MGGLCGGEQARGIWVVWLRNDVRICILDMREIDTPQARKVFAFCVLVMAVEEGVHTYMLECHFLWGFDSI